MPVPLQPGLLILHGNQLEQLRAAVFGWLAAHPLGPLETETILVQSNGVAEWLKIALAEELGVCAATRVALPARFLWEAYRGLLGRDGVPARSPFDKGPLTWRLMGLLPSLLAAPVFAPLRHFLADGAPERRLQLAERLADLYDQYQVYRADWLLDWAGGRDVLRGAGGAAAGALALPVGQEWQAALWRAVIASLPPAHPQARDGDAGPATGNLAGQGAQTEPGRESGRASIHAAFVAASAAGATPVGQLPRRVVLFGMSALPYQTLQAVAALARYTQVLLAVPNPCRYYWGDIIEGRELLRAAGRRQQARGGRDLGAIPLEDLHAHSHPLLAAWGRQGRDFVRLLDEFDQASVAHGDGAHDDAHGDPHGAPHATSAGTNGGQQSGPAPRIDLFSDDPGATLLGQVQAAVRDLLPLAEHTFDAPAADDRSIEFHLAHSAQREVEVLHDQLLGWLADPALALRPRDIVVMVPDIDVFAAAINAVFGQHRRGDPRFIPYAIGDVKDRSVRPLLVALDWLLRLPQQRCRQSEVRDLLEVPAVAARFGLAPDDLALLGQWIAGAGVRWGLNQDHRDGLGLGAAGEQNGWMFGVRRMLLGYASGAGASFGAIEPFSEVGGLDAALAGALAQLVETLLAWRARLAQSRSPGEWGEQARALLAAFFDGSDEADRLILVQLDEALQNWLDTCAGASYDEAVPLAVLRAAWLGALDEPTLNHQFVSGGVTFCTLMPMRAVPFRAVCLLGMNDGDFPRRARQADFDLLALPGMARPGDRSRRDDDRYLMLEAVLAARDKLYISWVGRNVRDNSVQPPSVLVSQLRDYLSAGWPVAPGDPALLDTLTTEHALQPFSRRYFEAGGLPTYAGEWRAAHRDDGAGDGAGDSSGDSAGDSAGDSGAPPRAANGGVGSRGANGDAAPRAADGNAALRTAGNNAVSRGADSRSAGDIGSSADIVDDPAAGAGISDSHGAADLAGLPPFELEAGYRLKLGELAAFLRQPARYFFRRRLGVVFGDAGPVGDDEEPFGLDALERFFVEDRLLDDGGAFGSGGEPGDDIRAGLAERAAGLLREGVLPIGLSGQQMRAQLIDGLVPVRRAWLAEAARYPSPAPKLALGLDLGALRLDDWIDQLRHGADGHAWLLQIASKVLTRAGAPRADKFVGVWLRQLGAAAAGEPVSGVLVARDAIVRMAPLDPAAALATLAQLAVLWRANLDAPIPVACKTALTLLQGGDARATYDGGFELRGEVDDLCLARLWPSYAALAGTPGWQDGALQLYGPLLDWLAAEVLIEKIGADADLGDAA